MGLVVAFYWTLAGSVVTATGVPLAGCNAVRCLRFVANGSTPIRIQRYSSHFAHFSQLPKSPQPLWRGGFPGFVRTIRFAVLPALLREV